MNHFVVLTFLLNTISGKNFLVELSDKKSSNSSTELESEFESETAFEEVKRKVETSDKRGARNDNDNGNDNGKGNDTNYQRGDGGGNDYRGVAEAKAWGCKGES